MSKEEKEMASCPLSFFSPLSHHRLGSNVHRETGSIWKAPAGKPSVSPESNMAILNWIIGNLLTGEHGLPHEDCCCHHFFKGKISCVGN